MGYTSQQNRKYRALIKQKQYPVCYLCGRPITHQNDVSSDHIIPKALGGKTTPANICIAHKICNAHKGAMTVQQWFDLQTQRQRE